MTTVCSCSNKNNKLCINITSLLYWALTISWEATRLTFFYFLTVYLTYSGNRNRYGGRGSDRQERGSYNNYNNYPRNRDDSYQNGENFERRDDWGGRGNQRGGGAGVRNGDREPPFGNDRWQEPERRDNQQYGGKWKEDGGNARTIPRGGLFYILHSD